LRSPILHLSALVFVFLLPSLCAQSRNSQPVEVTVEEMSATPYGVSLTLQAVDSDDRINMMIGLSEGQAIVRALRHQKTERPMTHDLLKQILDRNGWHVQRIVIRDLTDASFMADLVVERGGEVDVYDARPSDAMAIGLLYDAKIFVKPQVFEQERRQEQQDQDDQEQTKEAPKTLRL